MPSRYPIDPDRVDLAREFKADPFGSHSPALQRVLQRMRWGPVAGRYVLTVVEPHRRWMLAQLPSRPRQGLVLHEDQVFESRAAGEWEIFRRRWRDITGRDLEV